MKAKHIFCTLLFSFYCLTSQAMIIKTIKETDVISVTTEYVDQVAMRWDVISTEPNKPLIINYNIGTEYRYDMVEIYSINTTN